MHILNSVIKINAEQYTHSMQRTKSVKRHTIK